MRKRSRLTKNQQQRLLLLCSYSNLRYPVFSYYVQLNVLLPGCKFNKTSTKVFFTSSDKSGACKLHHNKFYLLDPLCLLHVVN